MKTRNWSIRTKIVALVAVPLVALLALWVFATSLTIGPALRLLSAQNLLDSVDRPGEVLVGELQKERRLSVVQLSAPADAPRTALVTQRTATDRAIADFRAAAGGSDAQAAASQTLRDRIRQMLADLDGLSDNRGHIDARQVDVVGAQNMYNAVVDTGFTMFSAIARFDDDQVDREIRGLTTVGRGQEYLSRSDALLAAGNTAGRFGEDVRDELLKTIVTARFLLAEGVTDLPAAERTNYQRMTNSQAFGRLRLLQDTLVTGSRAGETPPVSQDDWQPAYDASTQQLRAFELNATDALAERSTPVAVSVLVRLGVAGLLGLAAVIVSLVVSVRLGRSIIGRLRRLRGEALDLAGARLPAVVRRLRRGEAVDVEAETPPLEYGDDEIGEVGHAFTDVQRTAVQAAVEEAGVRRGINEVFLNIARRSQTLLHRQLALLDRMERRETEPDELEDLYRVDHLATRMRRHAEDLVILAGAAPGRGWRNPVPVVDVIRGAISEVEDYKRIDIQQVASAAVAGRVVGDVIHLIAELLENAASFSPPDTRVTVTGQQLPNGYALEIEDRGLGMSAEAIDEANRRLAEPPDFDFTDSARLGLFVVSRLAHRTGVKVSLRPSAYAGVTAVVLVPAELITAAPDPAALGAAGRALTGPRTPAGELRAGELRAGELPAGELTAVELTAGDRKSIRDQPLVGTGLNDPGRRAEAQLQWQPPAAGSAVPGGSTVPLSRRPAAGGSFGAPVPRPRTAPDGTAGGPRVGSAADGLSPEGLVRRRRTVPRQPEPADRAAERSTPEGLPRRVRQASLAPQLRETPADDQSAARSLRSPEQVRSIMSALQHGTARGRREAAGRDRPGAGENGTAPDFGDAAEAATVSLPIVRDARENPVTRPEKDNA